MRLAVLSTVVGVGAFVIYSCKAPEQIDLRIVSNIPCVTSSGDENLALRDVAIFAGPNESSVRANIANGIVSATIDTCMADTNGLLGDISLVRDASVEPFVAVIAGLRRVQANGVVSEKRASECRFVSDDSFESNSTECLVAVRKFRYSPALSGAQLRVLLDASCVDKKCPGTDQTCIEGTCASSKVIPIVSTEPPQQPPRRDASISVNVDASDAGNGIPPIVEDAASNVVKVPFRCNVDGSFSYTPKVRCAQGADPCINGQGTVDCSVVADTSTCEPPCCLDPNATNGATCCISELAGGQYLPLGSVTARGKCAGGNSGCFSEKECKDRGCSWSPLDGWGVCLGGK
jgi:hypothetical protein